MQLRSKTPVSFRRLSVYQKVCLPVQIYRKKNVLRLHVSGDFYDNAYIDKWIDIIANSPSWHFFSYTKSWRVPSLIAKLNELRELPNVNLFASTDNTSGPPPPNWREAAIDGMEHKTPAKNDRFMTCKQQLHQKSTCDDCKFCFRAPKGNVRFITH